MIVLPSLLRCKMGSPGLMRLKSEPRTSSQEVLAALMGTFRSDEKGFASSELGRAELTDVVERSPARASLQPFLIEPTVANAARAPIR
jgi:hypothetical protein